MIRVAILTSWGGIFPIPILDAISVNPEIHVVKVISQGIHWKRLKSYTPDYYLNYKDNIKRKITELNWSDIYQEVPSVNKETLITELRQLDIDCFFSISYGEIIGSEFLNSLNKVINFHPGLLPENKGADPFSSVLLNEIEKTGISIHLMDEGVDSGELIIMESINVSKNETYSSLQFIVGNLAAKVIPKLIRIMESPEDWFEVDKSIVAKYYKKPKENDRLFHVGMGSSEIQTIINTFKDSPEMAYYLYEDLRIAPTNCQVIKVESNYSIGQIIDQGLGYIIFQTKDYPILFTGIFINELPHNVSLQLMNSIY